MDRKTVAITASLIVVIIVAFAYITISNRARLFSNTIDVYDAYPDGQRYVHKPPTFKFKIHSNAERRIVANVIYSTDEGIFNKSMFFGIDAGQTIQVTYSPATDGHNGTEFDTFLKKYKWTVVIYNYTINGIGEILWQKAKS